MFSADNDFVPLTKLDAYKAIAWDFDGTLVDHVRSTVLQAYILARPAIRHYIVTFRSHGFQRQVFAEMRRAYPSAPSADHFEDVLNIADHAWEEYSQLQGQRRAGTLTGPLFPAERFYVEWKGTVCHRLGIPVLIDDRTDEVLPGCQKHGIDFFHPDMFMQ